MLIALLVVAVFVLAWSNGANDNFKGVATLYGSATTGFRGALIWATVCTVAGSIASVFLATGLARAFGGKGLIPNELAGTIPLLVSVGAAGAITILLATRLGMPTSTTHALTGALVGAGLTGGAGQVSWNVLATKFAQPLLLSPLIAVVLAATLYVIFAFVRRRLGVESQTCLCLPLPSGRTKLVPVTVGDDGAIADTPRLARTIAKAEGAEPATVGTAPACVDRYRGRVVGVRAQSIVDVIHYGSGGAVCFARAVNDTPKIAALLFAAKLTSPSLVLLLVAAAMSVGGVLNSRRVAETMSKRITDMNTGQGLTANLTTAGLVLVASRLGLPVSTTHVSCSSIFGIGLVNRRAHWKTIGQILVTWVTTLPLGLALGAAFHAGLSSVM